MRRTIDNGFELTGPISRGDWETVERHRTNLMRKLGVRSAAGVVAFAITHGYVGF